MKFFNFLKTEEERVEAALTRGMMKAQGGVLKKQRDLSAAYNVASGVVKGFERLKEIGGFDYTVTEDVNDKGIMYILIKTDIKKNGDPLRVIARADGRLSLDFFNDRDWIVKSRRNKSATARILEHVSYTVRKRNPTV